MGAYIMPVRATNWKSTIYQKVISAPFQSWLNYIYMICPVVFGSRDIVCGGGDGGGSEQHVCKVILVISLSLSQAEQ